MSLSSFFSAILNSHNKFAAASATPIILNILLILVLLFGKILSDKLVYFISYTVTFAGLIQLLFLIFLLKNILFQRFHLNLIITLKLNYFLTNYFQVYFHLE